MGFTEMYVYRDSVYFFGKIKDVRKLIAQYAKEYYTVQELINAKLN